LTSRCSNRSVSTRIDPSGTFPAVTFDTRNSATQLMLHQRPRQPPRPDIPPGFSGVAEGPQAAYLRIAASQEETGTDPSGNAVPAKHSSRSKGNVAHQTDLVSNAKIHSQHGPHSPPTPPSPLLHLAQHRAQSQQTVRLCTNWSTCPRRRSCVANSESDL
jgi:hypothetical protein